MIQILNCFSHLYLESARFWWSKNPVCQWATKSYHLLNFGIILTLVKPGLNMLAHISAVMAKAAVFLGLPPTLTTSNFAALWPTNPKFLVLFVCLWDEAWGRQAYLPWPRIPSPWTLIWISGSSQLCFMHPDLGLQSVHYRSIPPQQLIRL